MPLERSEKTEAKQNKIIFNEWREFMKLFKRKEAMWKDGELWKKNSFCEVFHEKCQV